MKFYRGREGKPCEGHLGILGLTLLAPSTASMAALHDRRGSGAGVRLAPEAGAPLTPATVTPRPSGRTLGPSGALRSSRPPGQRPAAAGGLGPLGGVQTLLSSPARRLSCLGSSKG